MGKLGIQVHVLEVTAHIKLGEPANGERRPTIRRGDGWAPIGHGELDPRQLGDGRGSSGNGHLWMRLRLCRSACCLGLGGCCLGLGVGGLRRALPRSFAGLTRLMQLLLGALRFAARLAEL